jgi:very-short-patch-repair endonuclease
VEKKRLRHIAFYQQKRLFGKDALKIKWCGRVTGISTVKRQVLLPDEKNHPRADNDYYKISFGELRELDAPVVSQRPRRILFIPTARKRLETARELNDIFLESPIEERLWTAFKYEGIEAERQYRVDTSTGSHCRLDFALFSKKRNIGIECDGAAYHTKPEDVKNDAQRDHKLRQLGWKMLRYSTSEINNRLDHCLREIRRTVNHYGGLRYVSDGTMYHLDTDGQLRLFG